MCRLLGAVADRPVDLTYWMLQSPKSFRSLSDYHAHGWGMGWYENGNARLVKEPISALKSERFEEQVKSTQAAHYLCHIRKATCGEHTMCNSHPFQYGQYLFGHNGSVDADYLKPKLSPERLVAVEGQTDSEIYFQFLLQGLESDPKDGLANAIRDVRTREYTALNFLLSDGHQLHAFWQQSATANPPFPEYYWLYLNSVGMDQNGAQGFIVCSEELDGSAWQPIPAGALLTINNDLSVKLSPVD